MEHLDKDIFEENSSFRINNQSKEFLKVIVFWSKFISVTGLMATSFAFFGFVFSVLNRTSTLGQAFPIWFLSLFTFIPLIYLFDFSQKLKESLAGSDEIILQKSIQLLKSYFKSIGVSMILVFVFYLFVLLATFVYQFYNL